ncbi:hypothetical protein ACT3CD_16350 [Geofilum sp. OHC36d9]|uniref:hypothetical protein n=1 Tax=Geofilum sp. OHC36d9 TaxID=3458413 RepID=UPI00403491B6
MSFLTPAGMTARPAVSHWFSWELVSAADGIGSEVEHYDDLGLKIFMLLFKCDIL